MSFTNWLFNLINHYLTKEKSKSPSYLCDFDRICHETRLADVLLIEGKNRISRAIQRITHSPWTHAVLYIGRLHNIEDPHLRENIHRHYQGKLNEQLIIESIIGKGTIISPITLYKNDHIRICRPTGLSYQDAQQVIAQAINSLGRQYNLRQVFDLARFLLKSRFLPMRWRSSLFEITKSNQASRDICSAVIADAFASIKFPILPLIRETQQKKLEIIPRNIKLFTPSDFDYSPYFDIIKYPIFSFSKLSPYRELPWNEKLISNDDLGITRQPPSDESSS